MEGVVFPPLDCSVTVPETVDFNTEHNPYQPVFVFSNDGKGDITTVSQLEFGRSADRVAHYVRPGRNGPEGQVVAFIALSDTLLYQAVMLGIMRAGCIPYPISHRNSAAAIVKLLKESSCHRLLSTIDTLKSLIDNVQSKLSSEAYELVVEEMPAFEKIFPKLGKEAAQDPFEEYPRPPIRPPLDDVMLYFHSSGSTGMPKTIPHTFRSMAHCASFPTITENKNLHPQLVMSAMHLPPFHSLAFLVQLLLPLYALTPVALYPPTAMTPNSLPMVPSPGNIIDHTDATGCNAMVTIPALLQAWAANPRALDILARLHYVAYGGGAVPSKLGNLLTEKGLKLVVLYGATEFGAITRYFRKEADEHDWEYTTFSDLARLRWHPQGDGTYECQILTWEKHQVAIENLRDAKGYATSDLWVPHPTKAGLWKIVGRTDDVIVHTSGEKTVPAPMEDILMSSRFFTGVVMFGRNHDQAGVLVELNKEFAINTDDEQRLIEIRNTIWPIVEEANKIAPAFSRIFKEMILIASPSKTLPRSGKGTIMRKAALEAYSQEIDALYSKVEATAQTEAVVPPPSWQTEDTTAWLKVHLEDMYDGKPFSVNENFFEQGLDSLGATILRRRIVGAMRTPETRQAAQLISQTTIYTYPSISKLAEFLSGIVADPEIFVLTSNRTEAIQLIAEKYTVGLSQPITSATEKATDDGIIVLLTGSTGSLGAHILASLLENQKISALYTLNRPATGPKTMRERHVERFQEKGLDTNLLDSPRLVYLEGEASHRNLGLERAVYEELRAKVTVIIHNAWKVDFNLPLSAFEPNIQGTRNLIDLARSSPKASSVKFIFTSSVASVASWDGDRGPCPEEIISDAKIAVGNGYGESKHISECILAQSGIKATSCRIGQLTGGPPTWAWATQEWIPILVKSSIQLGALPSAAGHVSWLPANAVSSAILEIAISSQPPPLVVNLVHPRPTPWDTVMEWISQALVEEGVVQSKIPVVHFQRWLSLLEKHSRENSEAALKTMPAIKLMDFFRQTTEKDAHVRQRALQEVEACGLPSFKTDAAKSISSTVNKLPRLNDIDATSWVKYWKSIGFL